MYRIYHFCSIRASSIPLYKVCFFIMDKLQLFIIKIVTFQTLQFLLYIFNHTWTMFLDFAGGSKTYTNTALDANTSISHACNSICGCVEELYLPVCGVNDVTFFSPCHAGCFVQRSEFVSQLLCAQIYDITEII